MVVEMKVMLFEIVLRKNPKRKQYRRNENQGKFDKTSKHNAAPAHGNTDKNDDSDAVFAVGLSVMKGDDHWITDSGASQHMTSSRDLLMNYQEFLELEPVVLGDGRSVHALGTGEIFITMLLGHTLCWIKDSQEKVVARGRLVGNMYRLDCRVERQEKQVSVAERSSDKLNLWHHRMAHLDAGQTKTMVSREMVTVGEVQSKKRLQLVHSDVGGPMKTESFGGARYFVTFIDDYSRVTNQADCKIKTLRIDNGGEYMSAKFQNFLKEKGIHHETHVPHSPQQNGIAERVNRTLQDAALSMILHAGVSKSFWAEAVCSAAYIRNRVITTATGVTPYERWYRLYDENKCKIFIRRDVTVNETDFGHTNRVQLEFEEEDDKCSKEESDKKSPDSRCSARERKPPVYYHDEYAENETWELVELPPGRKTITCRWVFEVKHDESGKIDWFKGRLVAKGFLQKYGIEFDETFSPVVRFTSIRALLALLFPEICLSIKWMSLPLS
ncbi:Retrovirus-related Pol poly from transposon TNT 1-94 [Paramuricea clavata]|uniref:Retrovirus-related Pol poly from transposon TNT 1-94 n=1 Tax=Paramuricea clavata TaxID=317549 RepID=A0A6S7GZ38_PARCT|nr:Retrovirus-related Pol poly from transposon TNT 1-94 [Paramuricea clavata]